MKSPPSKLQNASSAGARPASEAEAYRRLEWNELVTRGDFVEDGHNGFELWAGPSGFRADAFVKTIYRRQAKRRVVAKQTS